MFWHVVRRASLCPELSTVVLATDDARIFSAAEAEKIPVIMTRADHLSGTDRVLEAAEVLGVPQDAVVVNIQGDEPALNPEMLTRLVQPFAAPEVRVTTLAREIDHEEARNTDRVKVVFAGDGRALYFSRAPIPFSRSESREKLHSHIGIYAFRMHTLKQFTALGPSRIETIEKLEQLRLLENNIPIHVVKTEYCSIGVDRPEDLGIVSDILAKEGTGASDGRRE
jgi:3-deoxy-manno-octulosonate cytidylyltransferase (CMP-KDO synthetase)